MRRLAKGLSGPYAWSCSSVAMGEPRRTMVVTASRVCMLQKRVELANVLMGTVADQKYIWSMFQM